MIFASELPKTSIFNGSHHSILERTEYIWHSYSQEPNYTIKSKECIRDDNP